MDAAACGRGAGKASGGEYGSGKTFLAVGCKNEFGRAGGLATQQSRSILSLFPCALT
ncbi:MAG: hypothetical protein ABTR92_01515 [Candidatus Accumulibacter phosphatis]|uniref:hypothetical protein n=1 Tax=Candidatus Accumulibacter sp. ACC012 TaxID=2823332 RepID=UPI0025C67762|nr:hypothetical protein [Candidatus Accumulibacter sp. ACC012]